MSDRPSKSRLLLFAFGDFAFNLFWQSIMLFLLFYYTDALGLPIGVAATTYMVASIWDGIANFAAGILVDRKHDRFRYGPLLVVGAVPLGLTFVLTYLPPIVSGGWAVASVFVAHLLFRTAYAAVNVPYLAMTARVSADPGDRAFVAGMRMLFGTAAAVTVALSTVPVGRWLTGSGAAQAYFGAAVLFAGIGTAILALVGATYREAAAPHRPQPRDVKDMVRSLARNRSFVALNAAMMAMIVAITVLGKSVLYYFKYLLNDPEARRDGHVTVCACALALVPLALTAVRNVPPFLMLALPAVAALMPAAVPDAASAVSQRRRPRLNAALAGAAAAIAAIAVAGAYRSQLARFNWTPLPAASLTALDRCPGNVYNRYDEGGYLIWFAPGRRVFLDGRQDPYPPSLIKEQVQVETSGEFERLFERYGIRCAYLPAASRVGAALVRAGWTPVFRDSAWAVLSRN